MPSSPAAHRGIRRLQHPTMTSEEGRSRQVLIVSTDAVVAALLGTLVELDGHSPLFPSPDEKPRRALERLKPDAALVDCDHAGACAREFFEQGRAQATGVVLFSAGRLQDEVREIARRHGLPSFALPIDRATLGRVIGEAMMVVLFWLRSA
jgi:hypothetical protein